MHLADAMVLTPQAGHFSTKINKLTFAAIGYEVHETDLFSVAAGSINDERWPRADMRHSSDL